MHLVGYKVLTLAADPGTGAAGYAEACLAFISSTAGDFPLHDIAAPFSEIVFLLFVEQSPTTQDLNIPRWRVGLR
jgi:hypothetical protein